MSLKEWLTQFSQTTSNQPALDLYFLGDGVGESILVVLEQKFVAVIDAHGGSQGSITKSVLDFLSIKKIDYLQVSHLHSDHYSGIHVLLDNFDVVSFGRPHLAKYVDIVQIVRFVEMKQENSEIERPTSVRQFLSKVRQLAETKWTEDPNAYKHLSNSSVIFQENIGNALFKLDCVAPLAAMSEKHLENLDKIILKIEEEGARYISEGILSKFDPAINRSSVVNRLQFGDALIFLTGDTESPVINAYKPSNIASTQEFKTIIFKIPHHGSSTSNAKLIFDFDFTSNRKKIAVVCPYNSQGLPEAEVMQEYLDSGYEIFKTSGFEGISKEENVSDVVLPSGVVWVRVESNGNAQVRTWGSAGQIIAS